MILMRICSCLRKLRDLKGGQLTNGWLFYNRFLVGKALKAFSKLSVRDIDDSDVLKKAILLEYEVVGEVYQRKFRKAVKRQGIH